MPSVTLQVTYKSQSPEEVVCVVGNLPQLGSWSADGLQPMTKDTSDSRWTYTFECVGNTAIKYRYAVCRFLEQQRSKFIVQWETNLAPRIVNIKGAPYTTEQETFGEYGGKSSVQRGWLVDMREIRLWFEKSHLLDLEVMKAGTCSITVTAVDVSVISATGSIPIYVHNCNSSDHTPRLPAEEGESICMISDVITFSARSIPTGHDVSFTIQLLRNDDSPSEINAAKRSKVAGNVVATAYVMSSNLSSSVGNIPLYFFNDAGQPIGKVSVSYTVIEPLNDPLAHSMEVSYATYWKHGRTLNMGHRGMGKSHRDPSIMIDIDEDSKLVSVPENTICSLTEAAEHGADYVEFDVHVTKDGYPVLFHDFKFALCLPKAEVIDRKQLAKLSIKDMTLEDLKSVGRLIPAGSGSTDFLCNERNVFTVAELPFNELRMALETVPMHCGFDIEIKYPMNRVNSGPEYDGTPMDMNTSIDAILRVVLKYGGERRIFFSAFHPDVCAMIRLKQSKYPVMLCNFGPTDIYESYADPRSIAVQRSINTALAEQILGLCGNGEDYVADPRLVDQCHQAGLVLVCWGERTVDLSVRQQLTSLGVDGVIHDRMGTYPRGTKNHFMKD